MNQSCDKGDLVAGHTATLELNGHHLDLASHRLKWRMKIMDKLNKRDAIHLMFSAVGAGLVFLSPNEGRASEQTATIKVEGWTCDS